MSDPKKDMNSLLSKIFGCDMDLGKMMMEAAAKRFQTSWSEQQVTERRRRMHYILVMAAELAEIRKTTQQATAWAEWCIQAVINGDQSDLKLWIDGLTFKDEYHDKDRQTMMADIFAKFRTIAEEAYLTGQIAINDREEFLRTGEHGTGN